MAAKVRSIIQLGNNVRARRRRMIQAFGVLVAAGVVTACSSSTPSESSGDAASSGEDAKPTFTVGTTVAMANLAPHPLDVSGLLSRAAIYDTLVDYQDGKPVPRLAKSWEIAEDGLTLTLELEQGVTFHNGRTFDATAVKENIEWAQDTAHGVQGGAQLTGITVEAVDQDTVALHMQKPTPEVLSVFTNLPMIDLASDLNSKPIGTGPYHVESFTPRQEIVLAPNDQYWDGTPAFSAYTIRVFQDAASGINALKTDQLDAFQNPPLNQMGGLDDTDGIHTLTGPSVGNIQFFVNTKNPPLDDVRVRQALSLALDREAFVRVATFGVSQPTVNMWAPTSPAYDPADDKPVYDLEKAKDLLAQAGYADGFDLNIQFAPATNPDIELFAPVYQAALEQIGVRAHIEPMEQSAYLDAARNGTYKGLIGNVYAFANLDPALIFASFPFRVKGNGALFDAPEYGQMVNAAAVEPDYDKRIQMYRDLARYVQEQNFTLQIATKPYVYALSDRVTQLGFTGFGMLDPLKIQLGG